MTEPLTLVGGLVLVVGTLATVVRYLYLGQEKRHAERVAELLQRYVDLKAERDRDVGELIAENRRLTDKVISVTVATQAYLKEHAAETQEHKDYGRTGSRG